MEKDEKIIFTFEDSDLKTLLLEIIENNCIDMLKEQGLN